jgi:hypothetical protein
MLKISQVNKEMAALGIDTTRCDDGSDLVRIFMNKRATPKGTMCAQEYKETTRGIYDKIQECQEKSTEATQDTQRTLANHILRLHQHLAATRPINLQRFRDRFELLFDERMALLAEIRAAEVEGM